MIFCANSSVLNCFEPPVFLVISKNMKVIFTEKNCQNSNFKCLKNSGFSLFFHSGLNTISLFSFLEEKSSYWSLGTISSNSSTFLEKSQNFFKMSHFEEFLLKTLILKKWKLDVIKSIIFPVLCLNIFKFNFVLLLLSTTQEKNMKLFVVIPLLSQYIHFRPYAQAKSKQPRFSSISQSNLRGRVFSTISITRLCTEISTIQSFSFVTSEKSPCPGDKLFKISDSCTEIWILAISKSSKFQGVGFFSHISIVKYHWSIHQSQPSLNNQKASRL